MSKVSTIVVYLLFFCYNLFGDTIMNKTKREQQKLIIFFSKLSIGGMEKALIDFIRKSSLKKRYDITLYVGYVLEKSYLEEIKKYAKVKVICPIKWNFFGKIITSIRMNCDILKFKLFKNRYDCAICYTHHHKILSKLARVASDNNIVFVHTDLLKSRTKRQLKKLKKNVKFDAFKKVVCVSNCAKDAFMKIYPKYSGKVVVANNYINGNDIIEKSREKVKDYNFDGITFINIARHLEFHKQVSFIIEASNLLKKDGYKFKVLLLGDGPDHNFYQELVSKYDLQDCVTLLGSVINPYKYLKKSDAFVFSSNFEGYGIVLDEARVLQVPIITTDVADAKLIVEDGYGYLCENSVDGIYKGMKDFLENGYKVKNFNYERFNDEITKKINEIVG